MNLAIDEIPVAVDVAGQGTPVLLVHGFPLDGRMWRGQINAIAQKHKIINPDLPGFGQSGPSPHLSSIDAYADWLARLLDTLDVRQPVTLCGLSMGGYIAFSFFRRHRERLSQLILCDTKAAADPPEKQHDRELTAQDVLKNGTAKLAQNMPSALLAQHSQEKQEEIVSFVRQMIAAATPDAVAAASRAMARRVDSTDTLPQINVPTLLLCGEDDAISPPSEMQTMAGRIPNAKFVLIPGAGHLSPIEQPEAFNQALVNFLD